MKNNTDILNILELKSEESLIKNTQKLLKMLSKKENIEDQINIIKNDINILTEKKHHRIKEIFNNNKIDEKKLEFALKIINKDEDIFKQLNELRIKYKKEQIIKDLEVLKENIKYTSKKLEENINIIINIPVKKKETIIEKLKNKIKVTKQNEITIQQTDKIIQIIEQSKIPVSEEKISENYFNLKEEYLKKEQFKETIDKLYKKCRMQDTSNFQEIKKEIQIKTSKIIEKIEKEIEKLKKEISIKKKYDERLIEYVYNKQKNYIAHTIDHSEFNTTYVQTLTILNLINNLEKKDITSETLEIKINENEEHIIKKI